MEKPTARERKREHLVDVAAELFNRHGYHAAGVDLVIAEAGIAKTTLYRHFRTKEDLIVAVLRRIDERARANLRAAVDAASDDPCEKLLATFDFLESWFKTDSFFGCPFVSAAGEYGDRKTAVFREAAMHKRLVLAYFEELARAAGFAEPKRIADEVNLLHEGAIAVAHVTGDAGAAHRAKAAAARLLDAADLPR